MSWFKRIFTSLRHNALRRVLRRHLNQTEEGQQILQQFAKDGRLGHTQLTTHLRHELPKNKPLARRIAAALGLRYNEQFATLVNHGQIDQIINAKHVENLHQHINIFVGPKTAAAFVTAIFLSGLLIWTGSQIQAELACQPAEMTSDFNIAIAEFVEIDLDPQTQLHVADSVRQQIVRALNSQFSGFNNVAIETDRICVIKDTQDARDLISATGADLVIYGDVTIQDNEVLFWPKFYVLDSYYTGTSEVSGADGSPGAGQEYLLDQPIYFDSDALLDQTDDQLREMRARTTTFTFFTEALVHLGISNIPAAERAIATAIDNAEQQANLVEGMEVLYLYASQIARLQGNHSEAIRYAEIAWDVGDQNYGRALIARANALYDQGQLDEALSTYEQALTLTDQPDEALVAEKAHYSIGNIYLVKFQREKANQVQKVHYANNAIQSYQTVIDASDQWPENILLKDLAALAYYSLGLLYHSAGQCQLATQALIQAQSMLGEVSLIVSNIETIRADIDMRLKDMESCEK